jgi:hypothetical protein
LNRVFLPAVSRAGISNFRWHDLRHTFASRLVMARVDLRTVQELLVYKTLMTTLRYAHLSPGHQLDAVQRLNASATVSESSTTSSTSPRKSIDAQSPPAWNFSIRRQKSVVAAGRIERPT